MDSCKFDVIYYFPREVVTTKKCYDLLIKMNQSMEILADKKIFLDFTKTKRFETNLIVFLVFSLDRMKKRNNYTVAKLRNEKYVYNEKIIYELFKIYSVDKHAFLSPHKIGIREERSQNEIERRDL